MTDLNEDVSSNYLPVGGNFANVLDHKDYLALVNSTDTVGVVLRAHLILEEFLNIWCSKVTGTDDLFKGSFTGFNTKLNISKNLGLSDAFRDVLDRFNKIRNKYSHNRQYKLEESRLDSLIDRIDKLPSVKEIVSCKEFSIHIGGIEAETGDRHEVEYLYEEADLNKKIIIVFIVLVLKLLNWMQSEFQKRNIEYTIISDLN